MRGFPGSLAHAAVVELVDTLVLETSGETHEGLTPFSGTPSFGVVAELVDAAGSNPVDAFAPCRFDSYQRHQHYCKQVVTSCSDASSTLATSTNLTGVYRFRRAS